MQYEGSYSLSNNNLSGETAKICFMTGVAKQNYAMGSADSFFNDYTAGIKDMAISTARAKEVTDPNIECGSVTINNSADFSYTVASGSSAPVSCLTGYAPAGNLVCGSNGNYQNTNLCDQCEFN